MLVKEAIERLPPFPFNAWRFGIGAAVLALLARSDLRGLGRRGVVRGAWLGTALWAGYALQTFGLERTSASRAAFLTGMFVVFTPLLQATFLRRAPHPAAIGGALLAAVGLGLLSLHGSLLPGLGDTLVVGCALAYSFHILGLGAWSADHEPVALATVQLATGAVLHAAAGAAVDAASSTSHPWLPPDAYVWMSIAVTAVLASALAFVIMTAAQAVIPPTRAAIVMTMEPVFAWLTEVVGVPALAALGVTGLVSASFGTREAAGAALVLIAMLWTELRAPATAEPDSPAHGAPSEPPRR